MALARVTRDPRLVLLLATWLGATASACRSPAGPLAQDSGTSSTSVATGPSTGAATGAATSPSSGATSPTEPGDPSTTASSSATAADGTASTTGSSACDKHVVLMGYWPPTNEMLRPWSTNPAQNPGGWIGANWGGHGYDVYSFFPEFPPDGDPSNDQIGDDGAVGSPRFDLRVDYQATSDDFWRIVDTYQPVILVTTSRGGSIGWEVEAIEGGHGLGNAGGPELDWASDQHGPVQWPTEASIEPRSWTAISTHRQGRTLATRLPVDAIVKATSALGLTRVQVDETGTSGNFLSGFLGLHGLYYARLGEDDARPDVLAAGHIHVGFGLPVADASALIEATLHAVLQAHPADRVPCP